MNSQTMAISAARQLALRRGFDGFDIRTVNHDGVEIGYRVSGTGPTVLLIHGYPESGYEWHAVAADLTRDHRVVVPDYRGAAGSDASEGGYDKATMARDLHAVLADVGATQAHIVGHDIGMMVAYAYARQFPGHAKSLTLIDGVIPGTPMFANFIASGRPWHFGFHSQVGLATALVSGRERLYFDWLFDNNMVDPGAITAADRDFYTAAAQAPGALAAGFRTYAAATSIDDEENKRALAADGKLSLPVLGIGGAKSLGPWLDPMLAEVATDTRSVVVDNAGHFLAEEQPVVLAKTLRSFIAEHQIASGLRTPIGTTR